MWDPDSAARASECIHGNPVTFVVCYTTVKVIRERARGERKEESSSMDIARAPQVASDGEVRFCISRSATKWCITTTGCVRSIVYCSYDAAYKQT